MPDLAHNPYEDTPCPAAVQDLVKSFTIPTSGMIQLFGPEVLIIDTPEFQRLDGIKQLGTTNLVYRGARHTRFEHSLGTLHRAEQMLQFANRNPRRSVTIPPAARRLARLAALLHDLPHVPYGHTLEDEFGLLERHDQNGERFETLFEGSAIGETLRECLGVHEYGLLREVLLAKTDEDFSKLEFPFVADIMGNTLCADLLDYVKRDFHYCGMPFSVGDHFLSYLTITTADDTENPLHLGRLALMLDKKGMPRPDVESEVVKLLTYRYELAERVYFHHAKNAGSVMIGRAVQALGLAFGAGDPRTRDANFHRLSDELLLHLLENPEAAATPMLDVSPGEPSPEGSKLARELARGVRERRLYKAAYLTVADDTQEGADALHRRYRNPVDRAELEDRFASRSGLPLGRVLVHVPRPKMMVKEADVRVITSRGNVIQLGEWDQRHSRRISALNDAHRRLWRLTVYVHPSVADAAQALSRVQKLAEDTFGSSSRVRTSPTSAYLSEVFAQFAARRGWEPGDRAALDMAAMSQTQTLDDVVELIDARVRALRDQSVDDSGE